MSISFRALLRRHLGLCLLLAIALPALGQDEGRKLLTQVKPVYPENLKRFNISGTVKLEVVISPDGFVKDVKPIGGNPMLVDLAVNAVAKWKYAPAPNETTTRVELVFRP